MTQSEAFLEFEDLGINDYIYESDNIYCGKHMPDFKHTAGDLIKIKNPATQSYKKIYKDVDYYIAKQEKVVKEIKFTEPKEEKIEKISNDVNEKINNITDHINKQLDKSNKMNEEQIKELEKNIGSLSQSKYISDFDLKKLENRIIDSTQDIVDDLQEKISKQTKFIENFLK